MNKFFSILNWIMIFLSPGLLFTAIGGGLYLYYPDLLFLSLLVIGVGIILSVLFAERVRRARGTTEYLSRINHTDDIQSYEEIVSEKKSTEDKNVDSYN